MIKGLLAVLCVLMFFGCNTEDKVAGLDEENSMVNSPPSISGTPMTSLPIDQLYSFTPTAVDPDEGTLTFSITNQPDWAHFDTSTGTLTGVPGVEDLGVYPDIEITVCDRELLCAVSEAFSITVEDVVPVACDSLTVHCVDDTYGSNQEFSTIQDAVDVAEPGHTVVVYAGTYTGFHVDMSGTSTQPITIKAESDDVIINTTISIGGTSYGILLRDVDYVTLEGFTVDGSVNAPYYGIAARDATATSPMHGLVIRNNTVSSARYTNIYLSQVSNSLIEKNTAYGSHNSHGMYLSNAGSDGTILRGNCCYNNSVNGIHFNGDLSIGGDGIISGLTVNGNILYGNGQNGLNMDGVQSSTICNNLVYDNHRHALRVYQVDGAAGPVNLNIINNTLISSSNYGWPLKLTEDSGGHVIFNNILIDRGNAGAISVENSNLSSDHNLVSNGFELNETMYDLASWQNLFHDEASALAPSVDELFVNPEDSNFKLNSTSNAAIDQGLASFQSIDAPIADIDNTARPQRNDYDMGAYEMK